MGGPACVDCVFYVKPSRWKRFTRGMFAETCAHPKASDELDGSPTPCVTVRIITCERGQLFRPKQSTRG